MRFYRFLNAPYSIFLFILISCNFIVGCLIIMIVIIFLGWLNNNYKENNAHKDFKNFY